MIRRHRNIVVGKIYADLLITSGLEFCGRSQTGKKTLIVGLGKQIDLLRIIFERGCEIDPSRIVRCRGGADVDLYIGDRDVDMAEGP